MGSASSRIEGAECQQQKDDTLRFGVGQDLGRKRVMEDAAWGRVMAGIPKGDTRSERSTSVRGFFVVCDGHGGADAAEFTSQNLLKYFLLEKHLDSDCGEALRNAFLRTDADFQKQVYLCKRKESGTTALALAVFGSRMVIANAGDCRAVLSREGVAKKITTDHRPLDAFERQRIEGAGGFVDVEGYMCGDLGVSRAIGDHHYTHLKTDDGTGPLIAEPETFEHMIEENDEFVVVMSDGVTDALTDQTIVDLVRDSLRKSNCPETASKALVAAAFKSGVKDNLTAMTICFKPDPPSKKRIVNSKSQLRIDRNSESFADLLKALDE